MQKWSLLLAVVLAVTEMAAAQSNSSNPSPSGAGRDAVGGTIQGRVTGPGGAAEVGVPVTVASRDGRFTRKVETQAGGHFSLLRLAPGVYSVQVLLPTFLPFWKSPVQVLPGSQVVLDINLQALADSVNVSWPVNAADARDGWKWVLRSGASSRPILRLLEEEPGGGKTAPDSSARPLHGTVQFVAGSDAQGFASDPGLQTSFDMEYGAGGPNTLGLSGLAGWEQGTPAAGFRAAWNRRFGDRSNTSFSTAVRQVFLPGEYWRSIGGAGETAGERLQSVTFGYEHENAPTTRLRVRYGALVDTVSIGDRMTRWSPFGEVTYALSDSSRLAFSYAGTAPRALPAETDSYRQQETERSLTIPQLSSGSDLEPVLEEGRHLEAAWAQEWGPRYRAQAGIFYDSLSDVALSMTGAQSAGFFPGLLRDPFSNRYFLSGGNYSGVGMRASFAVTVSDHSNMVVGYSYAEGLQAVSGNLMAAGPQALREMVQAQQGHSFAVKLSTIVPGIGAHVITSYRWIPSHSVVASDPYDRSMGRADPYMNVILLQPLPSPNILPGHFEAVVDIRNLLAEGYMLVQTPEGGSSLLFPAARAFRGGFNYIF